MVIPSLVGWYLLLMFWYIVEGTVEYYWDPISTNFQVCTFILVPRMLMLFAPKEGEFNSSMSDRRSGLKLVKSRPFWFSRHNLRSPFKRSLNWGPMVGKVLRMGAEQSASWHKCWGCLNWSKGPSPFQLINCSQVCRRGRTHYLLTINKQTNTRFNCAKDVPKSWRFLPHCPYPNRQSRFPTAADPLQL